MDSLLPQTACNALEGNIVQDLDMAENVRGGGGGAMEAGGRGEAMAHSNHPTYTPPTMSGGAKVVDLDAAVAFSG